MSESGIWTPRTFGEIVVYSNQFRGDEKANVQSMSMIDDTNVSITSKTLHYGAADFEGARVDVHRANGGYRLHMLHYDWNTARLNYGAKHWGYGYPKMSDEAHMLAVVNLLYSNGWDKNAPIVLDGSGKPTQTFYVRPLIHLPSAKNITLRNKDPFDFVLVVFPQAPYHGEKKSPGMAVLHVPEERNLAAPSDKRADNYPHSMLWVENMTKFIEWIEKTSPDITFDGEKVVGEQKKKEIVAFLKENLREVLFNNSRGEITEGSAENVGIVQGNFFATPPIEAGALPGFSMQKLELIAQEMGMATVRERFMLDDLKKSRLAVMTGNAAGVVPIRWLVECDWKNGDGYAPEGNVKITSVGNIDGDKIYGEMKKQYDLIIAGKSQIGKFGAYADEFVSEKDILDIRQRTRELVEYRKSRLSEIAKGSKPEWATEKISVTREIGGLFGKAPSNFRTKLCGGRQITYAKLLNIK
ncbi:MAG: aminotransferase class IV [Candidatus Anstonellaceae archaeon]